jgi:hypothetical protein
MDYFPHNTELSKLLHYLFYDFLGFLIEKLDTLLYNRNCLNCIFRMFQNINFFISNSLNTCISSVGHFETYSSTSYILFESR